MEEKEKKEEELEKSNEIAKKKAEEKKKKLKEKFKNKRELVLQRNLSKTSNQGEENEEEDLCLLCHEAAKKNNQLVYLAHINKDKTICGAIYADQNKANTLITTCFHTIHVNCYIEMNKSVVEFNCPLCTKKGNCIFPVKYSYEEKRLNRICSNVINASMMILYKVYDNESNFILLFKHLLESKGLNSMISFTRYESEKFQRGKVDDYILGLLHEIYENSTEEQQKNFDEAIEELRK